MQEGDLLRRGCRDHWQNRNLEITMPASVDPWGPVVVVARFFSFCLDLGITKAFGVLIPLMAEQLQVSDATIGLVTSLVSAMTYFGCPVAMLLLDYGKNRRVVASFCGLFSGLALIGTYFTRNVALFTLLLFITGFSCSVINLHGTILLFQYYGESGHFAFFSSLTVLGIPTGSIILPPVMEKLVEAYGLSGSLLVLGGLLLNMLPICLTFKEPSIRKRREVLVKSSPMHNEDTAEGEEGCSIVEETTNLIPDERDVDEGEENQAESASVLAIIMRALQYLHVYILIEEPLFTCLYLPILWLAFFATGGWALFIVLYGLSQGIDLPRSALLATSGASGGVVASILVIITLRRHPQRAPYVYFLAITTSACFFFVQTLNSSYIYLLVTSFCIGAGLLGGNLATEPIMAMVVRSDNFADASSWNNVTIGLGYLLSGFIAGTIHDHTGSMKGVFLFLGAVIVFAICLLLVLIVCLRRRDMEDKS